MYRRIVSILDPNTRRRLRRFGKIKRAKWSLALLLLILIVSLFSNFIANEKPLVAKVNGKLIFPIFKYYSEDSITGSGNDTRPKYKDIERTASFAENKKNWMLWPLLPYGSKETLRASDIEIDKTLTLRFLKSPRVATLDIDSKLAIRRSRGAAGFYQVDSDIKLRKQPVESSGISIPTEVKQAIATRLANRAAPEVAATQASIEFSVSEFEPKSRPPKMIRLTLKEVGTKGSEQSAIMNPDLSFDSTPEIWNQLSDNDKETITTRAKEAMETQTEPLNLESAAGKLKVSFDRKTVSFPYPPVKNHALGIDESGRDVLVLILYATRIGLLFAICLVIMTFIFGIFFGTIQGYFGGMIDMVGQRFTEIWAAMPFLFIMILLSSIYGKGFFLLLFVYATFNWIGISLYMRAEFLRLRKQPFVESARVMGINRWKIMFRSILPNALVPVITFFPFELVGAIFSLTALDFLGFGLPVGTASWGDLLNQGKVHPYGWWLVLFPSLALFIVSLLGIFIGEGVRAAFDPRNESKIE